MHFQNKVILAPMAGVNDIAFRKLCTDYGADIVYSQMIDSRAFKMGNRKLSDFHDEDNMIAQFFGNDPEILAACSVKIERKARCIDLNLGCPHSNVVKRKCGAYLMKYPKLIEKIVRNLVERCSRPVTVKLRAGYDRNHINAVDIAKVSERAGASAIAVHGRARTVNYEKPVDYDIIRSVKESVNIPVVGNGDIFGGQDAERMFEKTGCDAIMVARAAIGNPAVFQEIKCYLKNQKVPDKDPLKLIEKYLRYSKKYKVEFDNIKKHSQWFTKGLPKGAKYRAALNDAKNVDQIKALYQDLSPICCGDLSCPFPEKILK